MITTEHFGHSLDEAVVKKGLRELNPDIHFDLGANINKVHPFIHDRQGVFYKGKHICSMDRGTLPEFSVWSQRTVLVSASPGERRGQEPFAPDMQHPGLIKVWRKRKHRCVLVGWRHTFEQIIKKKVPGITRESLAKKFKVPIKFWTGERETVEVGSWLQ